MTYQPGDEVEVHFTGTVTENTESVGRRSDWLSIKGPRGWNHLIWKSDAYAIVTVTKKKEPDNRPYNWPPRVNDMWRVEGGRRRYYVARQSFAVRGEILLESPTREPGSTALTPAAFLEKFAQGAPTLVFRP